MIQGTPQLKELCERIIVIPDLSLCLDSFSSSICSTACSFLQKRESYFAVDIWVGR